MSHFGGFSSKANEKTFAVRIYVQSKAENMPSLRLTGVNHQNSNWVISYLKAENFLDEGYYLITLFRMATFILATLTCIGTLQNIPETRPRLTWKCSCIILTFLMIPMKKLLSILEPPSP